MSKCILIVVTIWCLCGAAGAVDSNGLVAYWRFDEGEGTTAYDSAGSNDGILVNGPNWTTGQVCDGLSFDGVDDYVEVPDDDSLTPSSAITISFWLYNRGGQNAGIFKYAACPWEGGPGGRAYHLTIADGTGQVGLTIFSGVNTYDSMLSIGTVGFNDWHHVTGTFDQGQAAIYIDGQPDASGTMSVSSIMNDAQPLTIGGRWSYCGEAALFSRLNGIVDDVRVYNRALNAEEIWEVYQWGLSGPEQTCFEIWPRTLEFYGFAGSGNPAPQVLSIRSAEGGTLDYVVTEDCGWVGVDPNFGSCTDEPNEVGVSVDISGLSQGFYDCTLLVSDANDANNAQVVRVALRVYMGVIDYGDAPEDGTDYATTLARDGARHYLDFVNGPTVFLGEMIDEEVDGQPSVGADGDDAAYLPDEDGVLFRTELVPGGGLAEVEVTASCAGKLDAWIDFNADGDWADANEQIFASEPLAGGSNMLTFGVPFDANLGQTYARFRFSTAGGLYYSGVAVDGEVEDYVVDIAECMKETAPEYADWVAFGKPDCWCYRQQCRGDVDGLRLGPLVISINDLILFRLAINQVVLPVDGICSDFDHQALGPLRVNLNDLLIMRTYISGMFVPCCDNDRDCILDSSDKYNFWTEP